MILSAVQKYLFSRAFVAFACGVSLSSAFAPADMPLYALAALIVMFGLVAKTPTAREAALWGWIFGFGWFVSGINWVYFSMYHYGYMPLEWTYVTTVVFSLLLGLFPAAAFALANRLTSSPIMRLATTIPACFTLFEWLRSWVLTGFPWLNPAYAMTDWPLAGLAPIMGAFGVLLGLCWIAGLVCALWFAQGQWIARASMVILGLSVVLLGLIGQKVEWAAPTGEVSVRLIQPNLEPRLLRNSLLERFDDLYGYLDQVEKDSVVVDAVMLPESSYPIAWQHFPQSEKVRLAQWSARTDKTLLFNAFWQSPEGAYSNAAIAINPDSTISRYEKRHLVPFGEFVPWGFQWFIDAMRIPMSRQKAGEEMNLLTIAGKPAAVNICYENLFGNEWIEAFDAGNPEFLVNLSNLKWFGPVKAAEQHFQVSRMRAMEMARPLVHVTNSGVTGLINEKGQVVARLATDTEAVTDVKVTTVTGAVTPYVRFGDWIAIISALLMSFVGTFALRVVKKF